MTRRTLTAKDIMPNSDDPERELRELRDKVLASFPDQAPPTENREVIKGEVGREFPGDDVAGLCERALKSAGTLEHYAFPNKTSFEGNLMEGAHYIRKIAALLQAQAGEIESLTALARRFELGLADYFKKLTAARQEIEQYREALGAIIDLYHHSWSPEPQSVKIARAALRRQTP